MTTEAAIVRLQADVRVRFDEHDADFAAWEDEVKEARHG